MARYPGAKWDPIPENSTQATITPTQFIVHSVIAPWTADRIGQYWRESTNLESHFGLGYAGDLNQYIDTTVRADANASANVRAVSIETASNLQGTDPWTDEQLEKLVQLGVWLNQTHGIPASLPTTWNGPGMGYHRLYASWSVDGTACPGNARVAQFTDYVLPEINRRLNPTPPPTPEGFLMSSVLNSANAIDVEIADSNYVGLAFGSDRPEGPAVLHGENIKHDTTVNLLIGGLSWDATVTGRFYLTDPDGSNKSAYLQQDIPTRSGTRGFAFTNSGVVPEGRTLRFEVSVQSSTPATILHRLATGFYEEA